MKVDILLEVPREEANAFTLFNALSASKNESLNFIESLVPNLDRYDLNVREDFVPVPLFETDITEQEPSGFANFSTPEENPDMASETIVIACEIEQSQLSNLIADRPELRVWPNSELTLLSSFADVTPLGDFGIHPLDLASSGGGIDCRPFRPGVEIDVIRELLAVESIWQEGFRGQNIVVGIIDEGVNGQVYPVVGGYSRPFSRRPGTAPITSHGSMCAADILVAAPAVKIYDYPFLGIPNSGGALQMFQAVLEQRRRDGTPHLTNNSYGFVSVPDRASNPNHEIWDINHPLHRKVREVIASGAPTFFAAGNCGANCPSGSCFSSSIGPGQSIHASNSLAEVITIAAVNSRHERIGYSSQGAGLFEQRKPDLAAYSHFFGNFGPERPGGLDQPFDNGTSAATPVAAGVAALLLSAFPNLSPEQLKQILIDSAIDLGQPGFDFDTGYGVINAGAAYAILKRGVGSSETTNIN